MTKCCPRNFLCHYMYMYNVLRIPRSFMENSTVDSPACGHPYVLDAIRSVARCGAAAAAGPTTEAAPQWPTAQGVLTSVRRGRRQWLL